MTVDPAIQEAAEALCTHDNIEMRFRYGAVVEGARPCEGCLEKARIAVEAARPHIAAADEKVLLHQVGEQQRRIARLEAGLREIANQDADGEKYRRIARQTLAEEDQS